MKKLLKWSIPIILILITITALIADNKVESATAKYVYSNNSIIPYNRVGLLLGTSKLLRSGKPNRYFTYRIDATVKLFNARKIKYVVISGDNSTRDYNETQDMHDALVERGMPENRIYLDYAGLRTYDSVYRMKAIFGQTDFTIISQEFHNLRAIYIAKSLKLNAIGYNANDVTVSYGLQTQVREKFSRVKMFIDLAFGIKPKFLGDKIEIK